MQTLQSIFLSKNFYVTFAGTDLKVKTVKQLSEGAFAYVYLARQSKTTDKFFALKKITT